MLPERGVGLFVFANRTYAPASALLREVAAVLVKSDAFPRRQVPVSPGLADMAVTVAKIFAAGDVLVARESLAMNVLLDLDAAQRNSQLAALKKTLGTCGAAEPIVTDSAMVATLSYPCERGTLKARVRLAPTSPASLQTLDFEP
jgi:hypothetical protein